MALQFLDAVPPHVARALWDEIVEIERDPMGRGVADDTETDPEFAGIRMALGVAGYAIFYLSNVGVYVTSIRDWDF